MKKTLLVLFFVLISGASLKAQLLEESFDYPDQDSITSHGWVAFSGGTTNALQVTTPGLNFDGYQMPGIGNSCQLRNTGQDAYKSLSSNISSGSVYAFFLVNVTSASAAGDIFTAFLPSTSTTNFCARVYVKSGSTGSDNIAFGIIKNALSGGGLVYTDTTYSTGTTYLLVAKHTFVAGLANDSVSLTIFAPGDIIPSTEPLPTIVGGPSTTTDVADIGRFMLRQGVASTGPVLIEDEIYVGTDWTTTLPVEMISFYSKVNQNNVELNWTTASEINNSGFEIERKSSLNDWLKIGNVAGSGTINSTINYSYTDKGLTGGSYSYRLKQIDFNGNYEYFNLESEVNIGIPAEFKLSQNYPNPFNPSTVINYQIPDEGKISLKVYDISGKEISTLVNENKEPGYYSVNFNGEDLSSGIYFYTLSISNGYKLTKSMLLVK